MFSAITSDFVDDPYGPSNIRNVNSYHTTIKGLTILVITCCKINLINANQVLHICDRI